MPENENSTTKTCTCGHPWQQHGWLQHAENRRGRCSECTCQFFVDSESSPARFGIPDDVVIDKNTIPRLIEMNENVKRAAEQDFWQQAAWHALAACTGDGISYECAANWAANAADALLAEWKKRFEVKP